MPAARFGLKVPAKRAFLVIMTALADSVVAEMNPGQLTLVIFACCIGSLLIGAVGVGGVIILPAMIAAGVDPAVGIATTFVGMTLASNLRLILLSRIKVVPWRPALSAAVGAGISAGVGGFLVDEAPPIALNFLVGCVAMIAGLYDIALISLNFYRTRAEQGEHQMQDSSTATSRKDEEQQHNNRDGQDEKDINHAETRELRIESPPVQQPPTGTGTMELASPSVSAPHKVVLDFEADTRSQPSDPSCIEASLQPSDAQTKDTDARQSDLIEASSALHDEQQQQQEERWEATGREVFAMLALGLVTGFLSVMTGTGGPLVMLPMILAWKGRQLDRKLIVGSTAPLSATLVTAAAISTVADGLRPDLILAIIVCVCSLTGLIIGVRILQLASRAVLQGSMALLLLAIAVLTIWQAAHELSSMQQ